MTAVAYKTQGEDVGLNLLPADSARNQVELAAIRHQLDKLFASETATIRAEMREKIVRTLMAKPEFQRKMSWQTQEETIANVRNIITARLGLDQLTLEEARQKTATFNSKDFKANGIRSAFYRNPFFKSHTEALIAAFPEYNLEELLAFDWKTASKNAIKAKVRQVILAKISSPEEIAAITYVQFNQWGLRGAYRRSKHYSSFIDVITDSFPEYELHKLEKKRQPKNKLSWKTRRRTVRNVRDVVTKYLNLAITTPANKAESLFQNKINIETLTQLGLARAWTENKFFSSYVDLIIEAFPEYNLAPIFEPRRSEKTLSWGTKEETLENVQTKIWECLGIPTIPPAISLKEWEKHRIVLGTLTGKDMRAMKIQHSYAGNRFFNSMFDVLEAAFPEYNLEELFKGRHKPKEKSWATETKTIQNIRKAIIKELHIPEQTPQEKTEEWFRTRNKITTITQQKFINLGLSGALKNRSYKELIANSFPEYSLKVRDFGPFRRMLANNEKTATENQIQVIKAYLEEGNPNRLFKYIQRIYIRKEAHIIAPEEQLSQATAILLERLIEIRHEFHLYDLTETWRYINNYVRKVAKFKYTREQLRAEVGTGDQNSTFPFELYSLAQELGIETPEDLAEIDTQAGNDHRHPHWEEISRKFAAHNSWAI